MTNIKKLVAILLAILMVAGSASVFAYADNEPNSLTVKSVFGKYINGVWQEVTDVNPGDDVNVRIYLDSDFSSTGGRLLYFYDKDFFSTSYTAQQVLDKAKIGDTYEVAPYKYTASTVNTDETSPTLLKRLVQRGVITQEQIDGKGMVAIVVNGSGSVAAPYTGDDFIAELDFHVLDTATGTGDFYIIPETVLSPANPYGQYMVNRGAAGASPQECADCNLWTLDIDVVEADDFVKIMSSPVTVTFDANGGSWGNNSSVNVTATAGSDLTPPENPSKVGCNFIGWATAPNATQANLPAVYPDDSAIYYAVWEAKADGGEKLDITTRFFRQVDGEWVSTEKVKRGDTVKVRVYLASEYYANAGELLFFYDNDFFTQSYGSGKQTLTVNTDANSFTAQKDVYGWFYTADSSVDKVNQQIKAGYVTKDYVEQNDFFWISYRFGENNTKNAILFDDADKAVDGEIDEDLWFCEFELTVADSATGFGDLIVVEDTIIDPEEHYYAALNVSQGVEGSDLNYGMWLWWADVDLYSTPVSLASEYTFDPNGGTLTIGGEDYTTAEPYIINGDIGTAINTADIVDPEWAGHVFMGWENEDGEIVNVPSSFGYDDEVFTAKWNDRVTVNFETYGGTDIESVTGPALTPFTADIADPAKDGYTFIGWSTTPGEAAAGGDIVSGLAPLTGLPTEFPEEDATYYAVYSETVYSVKYYVLDTAGQGTLVATLPVSFGDPIATDIPIAFDTPDGYDLVAWFYEVTCSEPVLEGATVPAADISIYGKLVYADTPIKFLANGGEFSDGTTEKSFTTPFMSDIAAPDEPSRIGYTFKGWEPEVGIAEKPEGMTFKASWEQTPFTEAFYADGEEYQIYPDMHFGDEFEVPADPVKEGYEFIGWSDIEDSDTAVDLPATMPDKDTVYYAVFEVETYEITYDPAEGTLTVGTDTYDVTNPYVAEYKFGETIADVGDATPADYYEFVKWNWFGYDDETDDFVPIADEDVPAEMPAGDLKAVAEYAPKTYIATFEGNGGTWGTDTEFTEEVVYNEVIPAPAELPVKPGYTCTGYTNFVDGDTKMVPADTDDAGMTFTAVWEADPFTVTYVPNEGTLTKNDGNNDVIYTDAAPYTETVLCDEPLKFIDEEPVRDGYDFVGWDIDGDGEADTLTADSVMPAEDVVATAVWAEAPDTAYTIEYYLMDTTGTYPTDPTEVDDTNVGTTNSKVAVVPAPLKAADFENLVDTVIAVDEREGFTYDAEKDNVLSGTIAADGSLVLKVYYSRNKYNVTFDANGGYFDGDETATDPVTTEMYYGATITAPTVEKEGNDAADPQWAPVVDDTVPANDVTYVAQWIPHEHTISFNADPGTFPGVTDDPATPDVDESKVDEQTGDFGDEIVAPADPEKDGYDFIGWDIDGDGDVDEDDVLPTTIPDEDIEAEAIFAPKDYTVTFDANTGAFDDGETVKATEQPYESDITAPADPEKEGYDFLGWADTADATAPLADLGDVPMNDDTVLYAVYAAEEHKYTVTVHTMGTDGTYTDRNYENTANTDDEIVLEAYELNATMTQIVLEGTTDVVGGAFNKTIYHINDTTSVMTGTVTADDALVLDIYLDRDLHTVTYNYTYGPVALDEEQEYYYGAPITEFEPDAIEGYTFDGWYEDADCTTEATIPVTMGNDDIVVYGKYVINDYTVSYDAGEGKFGDDTSEKDVTGPFGQTVIAPEDPTREGYTFTGWTYEDEDGNEVEAPATFPAEDITATANWEINTYTFTAKNGDEVVAAGDYEYDSEVPAPTEPTKQGYLFAGWVDEDENPVTLPCNMPADDLTVYATFTPDTVNYTIKSHYINVNTGAEVTGVIATKSGLADTMAYIAETAGTEADANYVLFADLPEKVATHYVIDKENAGNVLSGTIAPDGSLVLDVWYVATEYPVTFNANGGEFDGITGDAVKDYTYGSYIEEPTDLVPVREGYTAAGWSLTDDNNPDLAIDFGDQTPAIKVTNANKVLYVVWVPDTNTVTFDAGEGTFTPDDPTDTERTIDAKTDETYDAPAEDPTRTGYEFGGWVDEDGNPATLPATMGAEPVVYEAEWIPTTDNTINWDANDGFFDDDASTEYEADNDSLIKTDDNIVFDSIVTPPAVDPIRGNYHFVGWASEPDAIVPDTELRADALDKTFYAVWSANNGVGYWLYIYEMDLNGEYPDDPSDTVKYEDGVTNEERFLTYTPQNGFVLDTTTADGNPASVLNGRIPENGVLILKAYLARDKYDFTAISEGSTVYGPEEYYYTAPVGAPADAEKTGYDFIGWTTVENDDTTLVTFPISMPAEDVTVYALFEIHTYTATFDAGEGAFETGDPDKRVEDVDFGDDITKPADEPVRDGYSFEGWAVEGDDTQTIVDFPAEMGSEDITYVPVWKENSFKATYYIPVRDADESSATYGRLSAIDTVYYEENADFGEALPVPADDPEILYYEFLGWSLTDANDPGTVIDTLPETMPATDVVFYAVFKRLPVYLIPIEGSTTQIDRGDGFYGDGSSYDGIYRDGTINDVSDTAYTPWSASSENVWYVYGLCDRVTEDLLRSTYCDVYGDGYYTVTPEYNPEIPTVKVPIGTSTTITVYDKVTGEVVETFKLVVFGDINGDGSARASDSSMISEDIAFASEWSYTFSDQFDSAKLMAGDLQRDFRILSSDLALDEELISWVSWIDQSTAVITNY